MFKNVFEDVLHSLSTPVLVGEPIFSENSDTVEDCTILFVNESFKNNFHIFSIESGKKISEIVPNLSKDVKWIEMANEAMKSSKPIEENFFSNVYNGWLRISMNRTENGNIVFSALNVDAEKKRELQLLNQNLRLEALTDELTTSKENLHTKLDNIENLTSLLQYNAYHDSMTDLYSKEKFNIDFDEAMNSEAHFGIILIGLDNIKFINDSQGHSAGDEAIRTSAAILKRVQKKTVTVYRFGGDEFIILVKEVDSKDSLLNLGDFLLELFNECGLSFSAGIAMYPEDTKSKEELLQYADMALADIKKKGKNNVGFFQTVMYEKFKNRLNIQTKLTDAIANDLFQLYFQPQFTAQTGELRGFEALLRWHDDKFGWISPEKFIPIAEESHLVVPIGTWVMKKALETLHEWKHKYGFDGIMSVNVSPIQLKKPNFLYEFKKMIKEADIDTKNLEIEITEGIFIENKDEMLGLLNQIRDMGIGISLDDFGTGYSSLSYLQLLPITTLKIDKSFIANITEKSGVEANITDSIVSMVTKMGLDTIAEGVETEEQLDLLKTIRCKTVQGFLKGKPMSFDRCSKFLSGELEPVTIKNDF